MSDVQALLTRCRELGAEFTPTLAGKLRVKAPGPLPDALMEELRQRKAEVLALLTSTPTWPCPQCGGQVELDSITDHLPTRFWHCGVCQTWGATREGSPYPTVWVSTRTVQ